LDNFFSRPKPKAKKVEDKAYPSPEETSLPTIVSSEEGELNSIDDEDDDEDVDKPHLRKKPVVVKTKSTKTRRQATQRKVLTSGTTRGPRPAADQSDLPPMSSIPKMFDDLVSRAGKLGNLVDRLNGRKLRVATMCSGTESPLLALRMITRSLYKETGKTFEIEHVFSCEIEPFKQAYIERNFAPPILFRDVLELANDEAYCVPDRRVNC
jgi:hypothetical protein